MIVITRRRSQEIRLGEDIVVTVLNTRNGAVKIGVTAPRSMRVVRGELPPEGARAEASIPLIQSNEQSSEARTD